MSERGRPPGWRRGLQRAGMVLGAGLFIFQIWQSWIGLAGRPFQVQAPLGLGVAAAAAVLAIGIQILAWRQLLRSLGVTMSLRDAAGGYILSFLPRYIPGTIWGYLSRNEWLAQDHQVNFWFSNLISVLEMAMILVTGLGFIGGQALRMLGGPAAWIGAPLIVAGMVALPLAVDQGWRRWRRQTKTPWPALRWQDSAFLIGLYIVFWLCHGATALCLSYALDTQVRTDLFAFTASFSAAWWMGFIVIFVPSGLGIREWVLSGTVVSLLGLPAASAGAMALLARVFSIISEALWAVIGFILTIQRRTRASS